MKKFFLLFVMAMMMAVTANAQTTYSLTRESEGVVDCDSIQVLYMRGKSVVINFEGYDRNDIWVDSVATMEYGGNLGNFTAEINTYADSVPFHMCWINVTALKTGSFAGHVTVHAEARGASGAVLHQDTLVVSFVGTIIPRQTTDPVTCDPIATFPWTETFNNISSGVPACWDNSEGTTSSDRYRWTAYEDNGEKCVRFDSYYNSNGNTNILRTPELVLGDSMMLSMEYKNPEGGNYYVTVISANGGRTVLSESLTGQAEWKTREFDLSPFANQTVRIGFEGTSNYGSGDAYLYLNDVVVKKGIAQIDTTLTNPEPVNYGLRAVVGVPVVIDSMRTNIAAHPETFVIGFEGYESGDLWFGTPVVEYGADLCRVTAKLNLYTAVTSSYLCLLEVQSYAFGGQFGGHVTMYAQALDSISGRVLHSDSLVVPFYGLILGPEPEPEPEFVVPSYIQMPNYEFFYTQRDSMTDFPTCLLEGGTRNCSVEWGWIENYNPQYSASGAPLPNSDITKPTAVYHFLKEDTAYTVESDPTSTTYEPVLKLKSEFDLRRYPNVDINENFYCRVYQNDSVIREQLFTYVNEMQVRWVWLYVDGLYKDNGANDGDSVPHRVNAEIDGPSLTGEAYIEWYNVLDTAEIYPVDVFRNGNTYYAKVVTPFDTLFAPGYVLNEKTKISWYGAWSNEQSANDGTYDNSGSFRSPTVMVDDVVWTVNFYMREGNYGFNAYTRTHRDSLMVDSVRLEMSTDENNWVPVMGENITSGPDYIDGVLPALAFRPGTYYFRFAAIADGREYVSQVYTIVIGGGINIDMENVTEGVVEYDAETNTVTISDAVIENVVTALTNMQDGVTINLDGITTMTAEENGILTSADIVLVGSYGEGFVSTDTMTIVAPRPIVASAEGVKITFDGVTLHLVLPGHEGDVVPGEVAARRQMSPMMRARYIAKTVLLTQDGGEESVISGFDEVDFINCGIIEPEGAEYDEDDLQLEDNGDPVYNCTIVPMNIYDDPMSVGLTKEENVGSDKRLTGGMLLIIRQEKVYTVMGQLVK